MYLPFMGNWIYACLILVAYLIQVATKTGFSVFFASNWQLPFLNQPKEKRKYVAGPGIEPLSQTPYQLRHAARHTFDTVSS